MDVTCTKNDTNKLYFHVHLIANSCRYNKFVYETTTALTANTTSNIFNRYEIRLDFHNFEQA